MTIRTEHGEMGDTLTRAEILAARGYDVPGEAPVCPVEPRNDVAGTSTTPQPAEDHTT